MGFSRRDPSEKETKRGLYGLGVVRERRAVRGSSAVGAGVCGLPRGLGAGLLLMVSSP